MVIKSKYTYEISMAGKYLKQSCFMNEIPPLGDFIFVVKNFFGFSNYFNDKKRNIVFGVYQCMLKYMNINVDELIESCYENKLNEFIHNSYSLLSDRYYYKQFCEMNIIIPKENF